MKKNSNNSKRNTCLLFIIASLMTVFSISSCHNGKIPKDSIDSRVLMVNTVSDTTIISKMESDSTVGCHYELGAEVDFPVDGPQPLVDSVRCFVTRELYRMFDSDSVGGEIHIPFEQVCEWHEDNIVTSFISQYSPLYEKCEMGSGAVYLSLQLVDQTEAFVTYYETRTWCGAGCSTEQDNYTFRKLDGHLLRELVDKNGLKLFIKKYPQYEDAIADIGNPSVNALRLTAEGLECQYLVTSDWPHDYNPDEGWHTITIPYIEIKPYLTKEAQELIQN